MGIELILVMKLPVDQTVSMSWNLGLASAAMVALGYPGEIQDDPQGRFGWWACAMLPFMYVVYTLLAGLNAATDKQPESAKDQDGWPRRSHSHHLRAGRLLDCRR